MANFLSKKVCWSCSLVFFYTILALQLLLWKLSQADSCIAAPYQIPSHVLVHHVIQSFQGTSSANSCFAKCSDNSSCHSINWYSTGLCELNRGNHLSYPEGIVLHSNGLYMLYSGNPLKTCNSKFCDTGLVCIVKQNGIDYRCSDACSAPLGMQDGRITQSQLNSSSMFAPLLSPHYGRLHSTLQYGCWASLTTVIGEYIQIDLGAMHLVSKVATQGRGKSRSEWVTKYSLMYSLIGDKWNTYSYGGIPKLWFTQGALRYLFENLYVQRANCCKC